MRHFFIVNDHDQFFNNHSFNLCLILFKFHIPFFLYILIEFKSLDHSKDHPQRLLITLECRVKYFNNLLDGF